MKKLILLLFFPFVFACSDDGGEEDETCLTCSNANFTNVLWGNEYDCDFELVVCVGETRSNVCFPQSVPATASELTISHINAIKTLWEDNGANCNLN